MFKRLRKAVKKGFKGIGARLTGKHQRRQNISQKTVNTKSFFGVTKAELDAFRGTADRMASVLGSGSANVLDSMRPKPKEHVVHGRFDPMRQYDTGRIAKTFGFVGEEDISNVFGQLKARAFAVKVGQTMKGRKSTLLGRQEKGRG